MTGTAPTGVVAVIQQVVAMVLLFALLSLLLPEGTLRGAVRAVMGLVVLAAIVVPLARMLERTGILGASAPSISWMATGEDPLMGVSETGAEGGARLVREGMERAMRGRALAALSEPLVDLARRVAEGAGYQVISASVQEATGRAAAPDEVVRLVLQVRPTSRFAVGEDALRARLAAEVGLTEESVEIRTGW